MNDWPSNCWPDANRKIKFSFLFKTQTGMLRCLHSEMATLKPSWAYLIQMKKSIEKTTLIFALHVLYLWTDWLGSVWEQPALEVLHRMSAHETSTLHVLVHIMRKSSSTLKTKRCIMWLNPCFSRATFVNWY